MEERFGAASAGGYNRAFGHVSRAFIPALLRAARVAPGQRVLDVATGTGIAAAEAVGPSGHVIATDLFPAMLEKARERLGHLPNVSFAVEDGQALTHPDEGFDAVLCAMGLMRFPDPARGLAEFRRVLRPGGRAAASVNTTPERAFATRVEAVMGRHAPERAATAARYFSLGDAGLLRSLSAGAGFREVETFTEVRRFPFASFDAYFAPIEEGQGPVGQAFGALRPRSGASCARRSAASWRARRRARAAPSRSRSNSCSAAGGGSRPWMASLGRCGSIRSI